MRSGRFGALVAAFGLAASLSPAVAQSGGSVTIRVSYSNSMDRLRPEPKAGIVNHHRLTAVLSGAKTVNEAWDSRSGRQARQSARIRELGGGTGETGGRWQVAGPDELVRIIDYPQNQTVIRVKVTGRSCQATVTYQLKPGFSEFTFRRLQSREIAYYRGARMTSSSCAIE